MKSLTYLIKAFGDSSLEETIKSISEITYENKQIAIITEQNNIEKITEILNKNSKPKLAPEVFNKFPYGIPTFCLSFGEGKIKEIDGLNSLIKSCCNYSDVYSVLNAGTILSKDHSNVIIDSINELYGVIGIVYSDYYKNKLRIYQEPYIKEKLLNNNFENYNYSFSQFIIQDLGLYVDSEKEFKLKVLSKYMGIHIPHPLFQIK